MGGNLCHSSVVLKQCYPQGMGSQKLSCQRDLPSGLGMSYFTACPRIGDLVLFWWSQREDDVVVMTWGPQKEHKHCSTHSSSFCKCLSDKWWPVMCSWSLEAETHEEQGHLQK